MFDLLVPVRLARLGSALTGTWIPDGQNSLGFCCSFSRFSLASFCFWDSPSAWCSVQRPSLPELTDQTVRRPQVLQCRKVDSQLLGKCSAIRPSFVRK